MRNKRALRLPYLYGGFLLAAACRAPLFSAAANDAVIREAFGADVQVETANRPLIFAGDFNGDGHADTMAIVTVDSKRPRPKKTTVLTPWGPTVLPVPPRTRALALVHRKESQILARFLLLGDFPSSWEREWEDMGVAVVDKKEGKQWLGGILPKGDLIRTYTQAGIDTFLYWDGATYRNYAPDEDP